MCGTLFQLVEEGSAASESEVPFNAELCSSLLNTGESGLTNPVNNLATFSDSPISAPEALSRNQEQTIGKIYIILELG